MFKNVQRQFLIFEYDLEIIYRPYPNHFCYYMSGMRVVVEFSTPRIKARQRQFWNLHLNWHAIRNGTVETESLVWQTVASDEDCFHASGYSYRIKMAGLFGLMVERRATVYTLYVTQSVECSTCGCLFRVHDFPAVPRNGN